MYSTDLVAGNVLVFFPIWPSCPRHVRNYRTTPRPYPNLVGKLKCTSVSLDRQILPIQFLLG